MSNIRNQHFEVGPLSGISRPTNSYEKMYRDFLKYSISRPVDEANFVIDTIPNICPKVTYLNNETTIYYEGVEVQFPSYTSKTDTGATIQKLLTPSLAKKMCLDYTYSIYIYLNYQNNITGISKREKKFVGNFPCVVRSKRCVLSHIPNEIQGQHVWDAICGEDPASPIGGYIIRDGQKKGPLYFQRVALNQYILYERYPDKVPMLEITISHKLKTYLFKMSGGRKSLSIRIYCPHLKSKSYSLFLVLFLLCCHDGLSFDINIFISIIVSFAEKNQRNAIGTFLETSKRKFEKKFCIFDNGMLFPSNEFIDTYLLSKTKGVSNDSISLNTSSVVSLLNKEIFPNCQSIPEKIINVLYASFKHIQRVLGFIQNTNRDKWGHKRVITFAKTVLIDISEKIQGTLYGTKKGVGLLKIKTKKGASPNLEPFKVDTPNTSLDLLSKIGNDLSEETRDFGLRSVAKSGFGGICPIETVDGEKCGLISYISALSRISNDREFEEGRMQPIFDYFLYIQYTNYSYSDFFCYQVCLLNSNGIVYNFDFFASQEFVDLLIRRNVFEFKIDNGFIVILTKTLGENNTVLTWYGNFYYNIDCQDYELEELKYLVSIINSNVSMKKSDEFNSLFIFNGNVLITNETIKNNNSFPFPIWVNLNNSMKYLKDLRKNKRLPYDCSIYGTKNELFYSDEAGRIITPYFKIDEEDDQLVLLKKNVIHIWDEMGDIIDYNTSESRVNMLVDEGIVEWINQIEIDYLLIAYNLDEYLCFLKLRRVLDLIDIEGSISFFSKIKDSDLYVCEDISYVNILEENYNVYFTKDIEKYRGNEDIDEILKLEMREDEKLVDVYGLYSAKRKIFKLSTSFNIILKKENFIGCYQRDGLYYTYIENGEIKYFKESDEIPIGSKEHKGNKILLINHNFEQSNKNSIKKVIIYIKENGKFIKHDYNPSLDLTNKEYLFKIEDSSDIFLENKGTKYFTIDNGTVVLKYTLKNGKKYNNEVDFEGKKFGFFKEEEIIHYEPVLKKYNYENFNINNEIKWFENNKNSKEPKTSDYEIILIPVRNKQEHLINLKFSNYEELNDSFNYLQLMYPDLKKKKNIFQLREFMKWKFRFTHVPINPSQLFSSIANIVPYANNMPCTRFQFRCGMGKQSLGLGYLNPYAQFDTSIKRFRSPEGKLVETISEEPLLGFMSTRFHVVNFFLPDPLNQDDSISMSYSLYRKLRYDKFVTVTVREKFTGEYSNKICIPKTENNSYKNSGIYRHLDSDGIAKIGSIINIGDVLVGQVKEIFKKSIKQDISTKAVLGGTGKVVQIHKIKSEKAAGEKIVRIKLMETRNLYIGDKIEAPYSQKCTISCFKDGKILGFLKREDLTFFDKEILDNIENGNIKLKIVDDNELPRVVGGPNDGLRPDLIFNPIGLVSRVTIGMLIEGIESKKILRTQIKGDSTIGVKRDLDEIQKTLKEKGCNPFCIELVSTSDGEIVKNPKTGKPVSCTVIISSYNILKHHACDKKSKVESGLKEPSTRQPIKGRAALRIGELDGNCFNSHGAMNFMLDRYVKCSDPITALVCTNCGFKTSDSDVVENFCKICKKKGNLALFDTAYSFELIENVFRALGVGIKMTF